MAQASNSSILIPDGSFDWSGGVDSSKVTTVASELNPGGLKRNQLHWLNNATVRGGGIWSRSGWQPLVKIIETGRSQGGFIYEPDNANPYLVCSISGVLYRVLLEAPYTVTDLTGGDPTLLNPADAERCYFCQAENYLVIQAGDYYSPGAVNQPVTDASGRTLPLFWDGTTLRRSNGITGNLTVGGETAQSAPTPISYRLQPSGTWNFRTPVNNPSTINLTGNYPGTLGDVGSIVSYTGFELGTFEIDTIGVNTITVNCVSYAAGLQDGDTIGAWAFDFKTTVPLDPQPPSSTALGVNEIPAATAMDYYGGRLWYAQSRTISAGDMVGGPSGALANHYRDAVLRVTENPLVVGGDGFTLPTNSGNIRAIKHSAQLNASLGQGQLFIFTRQSVYMLTVPETRTDWINADATNQPKITVMQITNGAVGDLSIVPVNGDLFYQSFDPAIRSLITAVRYFQQWGNTPISQNEARALDGSDRSLMRFSSAIEFNNRLFNLVLPRLAADGVNVVHDAILPLDFDVVTNLEEKTAPVWEGAHDGLQFLQLLAGDFGGLKRAFATVVSDVDGSLNVWEITLDDKTDNGDNRITLGMESPAFTWSQAGLEYKLKWLKSGQLWLDRISGTVEVDVYYRVDGDPCWRLWVHTSVCAARNCAEQDPVKVCYPEQAACESYRTIVFPEPKAVCDSNGIRPSTIGYQFQVKALLKGFARIRGLLLYALPYEKPQYDGIACPANANGIGMAKLPNAFA